MDSWLNGAGQLFDPAPRVSAVPIAPGEFCIVVDEALANPDGLVGWAAMQDFRPPQGFPYPGVIVDAPPAVSAMAGDTLRSTYADASAGAAPCRRRSACLW